MEYHLSRFYKETRFYELGNLKAVEFMSKDTDPFFYIAGVLVKKDNIFVCEVLFPNREAFEKWGDAVKGYIRECEIK